MDGRVSEELLVEIDTAQNKKGQHGRRDSEHQQIDDKFQQKITHFLSLPILQLPHTNLRAKELAL